MPPAVSFTQSVLDAVLNDPGGTAEAIRERHGNTRTVLSWERALDRLAAAQRIYRTWAQQHGGAVCFRVYRKHPTPIVAVAQAAPVLGHRPLRSAVPSLLRNHAPR